MTRSARPQFLRRVPRREQGSGIIEILVLIMVMSVGMLAMGKIHTVLLRDGGTASNRAVAASLAQQKIDDLRGFKWIDVASSGGQGCGNGVFCFSEIATNTGGSEDASGSLILAPGTVTVNNVSYTRSWTVANNTQFKFIAVTVSWTDQNGTASVILQTAIATDDANITSMGAGAGGTGAAGPVVKYTPIGVPDVVPVDVDLGQGLKKETSKPLPDVSSQGYSVRTQFESVVYGAGTSGTEKKSVDDFATVSCTCAFAGTGAGNSASYFVYEQSALSVKYPSSTVTKVIGTAPTIQGDKQDDLCSACCNDHHDSQGPSASNPTTALYDPDRPSSDYQASGNHKHYYFVDANNPQNGLNVVDETVVGNKYLEACRFVRVDGVYRLLQDWRLVDITVMPKDNYLVDGSAALSAYQTYIGNVVTATAKSDGGLSTTLPSKSSPTLNTRDLSNQAGGTLVQLAARGIYVDRVYQSGSPRTLDSTYYDAIKTSSSPLLSRIPFNEINVTLLASWESNQLSVATVTSEEIKDIAATTSNYYGTYSRGRVAVQSGNGGNADITAHMLPSTSGLTGGATRANYTGAVNYDNSLAPSGTIAYAGPIGIDRDDHRAGLRKSNSIQISRSAGSGGGGGGSGTATYTITGIVAVGNTSASLASTIAVTGSPLATCSVSAPTGSQTTFSCTVSSGYTGTLTITSSQTGAFVRTGLNGTGSNTCALSNVTANSACGTYYAFGPTSRISGSCADTGQSGLCSTGLTLTASGGINCTLGASPHCEVPVSAAQPSWSGSITVTAVVASSCKTTGNSTTCSTPTVDIQAGTGQGTGATKASCRGNASSANISVTSATAADVPSAFNVCAE